MRLQEEAGLTAMPARGCNRFCGDSFRHFSGVECEQTVGGAVSKVHPDSETGEGVGLHMGGRGLNVQDGGGGRRGWRTGEETGTEDWRPLLEEREPQPGTHWEERRRSYWSLIDFSLCTLKDVWEVKWLKPQTTLVFIIIVKTHCKVLFEASAVWSHLRIFTF